jgi:plastocyanin
MKHLSPPFRAASTLAALLLAILCTTALVSNARSAPAKRPAITIDNYTFHPAVLTVAKGTTVVWINKDDDVHTIKGKDGPETFQSPGLETGARYGFTFSRPGTYHYICTVHPYMHGAIVVR